MPYEVVIQERKRVDLYGNVVYYIHWNHKIWQHYESNRKLAALYDRLWREADEYAMNNFKGEELDYYYRITD